MVQWQDRGIILAVRPHGEHAKLLHVFTCTHGKAHGLLRLSRKHSWMVQKGNLVQLHWQARLAEHLGQFRLEPLQTISAGIFSQKLGLAALNLFCALLDATLAERHPYTVLYRDSEDVLKLLQEYSETTKWWAAYAKWECNLLASMGYGLDLQRCALTQTQEDLAFVSPKTGRAVNFAASKGYHNRLFPLPEFLINQDVQPDIGQFRQALALTGFFLEKQLPPYRKEEIRALRGYIIKLLEDTACLSRD